MFNIQDRTILLCKHGSHAYGLSTPESDLDLRGVCIEPIEYIVGFANSFEQAENVKYPGYEDSNDCTIFSLLKFAKLAADANPNVIEILFVEDEEVILKDHNGQFLIQNRDLFLTKKAFHTFGGYAKGQLKRLENHRQWIVSPPNPPPTREEFGLPSTPVIPADQLKAAFAAITKKLDQWNLKDMTDMDRADRIEFINAMAEIIAEMNLGANETWNSAGKVLGFDTNFLLMLDKERTFNGIKQHFSQYENWLKTRNKKRFETEEKCLCDTKHASHLIRLYMECIDVLKGNGLILKRPKEERDLLLDIKTGKWGKETYSKIIEMKDRLDKDLNTAFEKSTLPNKPDLQKIDEIVRQIYLDFWMK